MFNISLQDVGLCLISVQIIQSYKRITDQRQISIIVMSMLKTKITLE